ncbi:hypothetical protein [Rhizomonospora bruguierae]|uniref:hypothetical protein n=1 Tax=Rhizomonospora bruguierae TaxID=1581705 RepID=UPI001BCAF20D|nr:hypothetical protein [Micromonospora sp. NBRC 107566]
MTGGSTDAGLGYAPAQPSRARAVAEVSAWLFGAFAVAAAAATGTLRVAHPGMYLVALAALLVPAVAWGAFLNSLLMFSRDSPFLYTPLDDPLWFVAGVRLPLFALPVWVKAIGLAFPPTTSLTVLRGALLEASGVGELSGELAMLAALSVALFALTAVTLRIGEWHAQTSGSLQLF